MPFSIVRNDITQMRVDAVVNAANRRLAGGSGVNGAIHKAAGPELDKACAALGGCETGQAKLTPGFALPARYIIHTVGPIWQGGRQGERELLASCYRSCLDLAKEKGLESVAFPLISAGVFGYPREQALRVAVETIGSFLLADDGDMSVYLVVYGRESLRTGEKLFAGIEQFIDDAYVDLHSLPRQRRRPESWEYGEVFRSAAMPMEASERPRPAIKEKGRKAEPGRVSESLEEALEQLDESFSQMVLRKIAERGMKNSDCYKRANIDKKLFSKIYNDIHYKPKKTTALALAIALELSLEETGELLMKAGLALNRSEKFDVIVEYFIRRGQYDIFEINEALFYYDQALLGGAVY